MVRVARSCLWLASLTFAVFTAVAWVFPEEAGRMLGLGAIDPSGTPSIRADIGGVFGSLAALCAVTAWTMSPTWILASAVVVVAIALGRALGWMADGVSGDAGSMAVELFLLAVLFVLWRAARLDAPSHSRRSRMLAVLGALALVSVIAVVALADGALQQRLYGSAAGRMAANVNSAPLTDDALRVAVCGSSAPLPSARRAKTCVAVFAGGKFYVVDVGPESVENLMLWGIPMSSIGGVLLTHFHSDHIGDLGELNLQTWAGGRTAPLNVFGGPGVDRVVHGFNAAYELDQSYRTAHHTARVMPPETWPMVPQVVELQGESTAAKNRTAVVLETGGLRITAIEVDHAPIAPAYAYRFDYKGRSAVITGDLKYHEPLTAAAAGADLMVSEAIAVEMTRALGAGAQSGGRDRAATIMHDIEDYHITPTEAARIANAAGVKLLAFYHLLPAPDGPLARSVFARGLDAVRSSGWTIADDGSLYTLPVGTDRVELGRIDR
jgi:ribonuclease Z